MCLCVCGRGVDSTGKWTTYISTAADAAEPLLLVVDGRQVGHVRDRHGRPSIDAAVAPAAQWIDRVAQFVLPLQRIPDPTEPAR